MPCNDNYPPTREQLLDAKAPAMLCAILSALTPDQLAAIVDRANWTEAGVTAAEFVEWRGLHQRKDQARRLREADQRLRQRLAAEARAALTPEQLAALKAEGV